MAKEDSLTDKYMENKKFKLLMFKENIIMSITEFYYKYIRK